MRTTKEFHLRSLGRIGRRLLRLTMATIAFIPALQTSQAANSGHSREGTHDNRHGPVASHVRGDSGTRWHAISIETTSSYEPGHLPDHHSEPNHSGESDNPATPDHPDHPSHPKHVELTMPLSRGRGRDDASVGEIDEATGTVLERLRVFHLVHGEQGPWRDQHGPVIHGSPPPDNRSQLPDTSESERSSPVVSRDALPWMLQAMRHHGLRSVVIGDVDDKPITVVVPPTSVRAVHRLANDLRCVVATYREDQGRTQRLSITTPFGDAHVYTALRGVTYRQLVSNDLSTVVYFQTADGRYGQRVMRDISEIVTARQLTSADGRSYATPDLTRTLPTSHRSNAETYR